MSSDSELDEFYDAEDSTPNRSTTEATVAGIDIGMGVQELLPVKIHQEEGRKMEDEELQKRLETLAQKKSENKERKSEQKRRASLENRRRKHEEMRRKKTDSKENSVYMSSEDSDADINVYDDTDGGGIDHIEEKPHLEDHSFCENVHQISLTLSRDYDCGIHLVQYDDLSVTVNTSKPDMESKQKHDIVAKRTRNESLDSKKLDVEDVVDSVLHSSQLLGDKNEPDIVRSTKVKTPPGPPLAAQPTAGPSSDVLDRVTSTEPKAPPRKKKKPKNKLPGNADNASTSKTSSVSSLPSSDSNVDSSTLSQTDPQLVGLPPEYLFVSEMLQDKLNCTVEQSLDLHSLMKGKKHIIVEDAEVDAVNSDLHSPRDTVEAAIGSQGKAGSLDGRSEGGRVNKTTSLERDRNSVDGRRVSISTSLERDRSLDDNSVSKTTSLERDRKSSKGSILESEGKKSKTSSLESKSSSLDKQEHRRSRTSSGQDGVSRKESLHRPQSTPGKPLTDEEILLSVMVKNLDTGETVPLKDADQKLPKCVDPLVLHIMERTGDSDRDDDSKSESGKSQSERGFRIKGVKLKKFFESKVGKTVSKVKHVADHVMYNEDSSTVVDGEISDDGRRFKFKANHNKKGPWDFGQLRLVQDLGGEHIGAVWCMKFSPCGRLLATGGQDTVLRIWVLETAYSNFDEMRQKYNEMKVSPSPSQESLNSIPSCLPSMDLGTSSESEENKSGPFNSKPFCKYKGHTADLLDVTWSKNYFILTSSMDKTVRLWHISRRECLCTFQHMDLVTSSAFHPKDDRYFLSGSLDGKLRLWNIPDKKVTLWNEVDGGRLITAANFCHNGKFAVVGTYDGKCIFYSTEHLKYYTEIHVRSTRGKNSKGRKITSIEPLPGEDKVLVTSNDSRVRLYDLRDLTLNCKYRGPTNTSSQIKASFSSKGKYIVCGSEDHFVYIWRTQHEVYKFSSARRDRNDYYEAFKVHNAVVTVALFAPSPQHFLTMDDKSSVKFRDSLSVSTCMDTDPEYVISADLTGCIKVIKAK